MSSKKDKSCADCINWSRHVALDGNGEPVKKAVSPFVWYYEECKKHWGQPKTLYLSPKDCPFFKQVSL